MRIDAAGNVGIGTSSPLGKLGVKSATGTVGFNGGVSSSPDRGNLFYDTDGTGWRFNIGKLQSGTFTPQMTFRDGGNVGIGDTNPGYRLEVSASANEIFSIKRPGIGEWLQGINSTNSYTLSKIGTSNYFVVDTNGNIGIGGTTAGASSVGNLHLFNGTAPTGSVTDGVILYSEDVSSSAELKVRDEAGNVTTLSPHNFSLIPEGPSEDMAWSYYSERDGKKINADITRALRLLENLTGEKLVYTKGE